MPKVVHIDSALRCLGTVRNAHWRSQWHPVTPIAATLSATCALISPVPKGVDRLRKRCRRRLLVQEAALGRLARQLTEYLLKGLRGTVWIGLLAQSNQSV